jgi:hypothetical protein
VGRRESGFHRKAKRLLVEAGQRFGFKSQGEKTLIVRSKKFVVDVAWYGHDGLRAIFEVERGFTWDTMHVLGHLAVLNVYAQEFGSVLPCGFLFDENLKLREGSSAHSSRLFYNWQWYVGATRQPNMLDVTAIPVYWNRNVEFNVKNFNIDTLSRELSLKLPSLAPSTKPKTALNAAGSERRSR